MNELTIDLTQDIQSVTTVPPSVRQTSSNNCGRTSAPWSSTVKGKAAAVVQDAGAYQRLLDIAAAPRGASSSGNLTPRSRKSMAYIVELMVKLMPRARRDLRLVFDHIHAGASPAALRRYQGLEQEILSREQTPNRSPAAAENGNLRHLLYGRNPHV